MAISWYKPFDRFISTYGYAHCKSNRVRLRWHTHCRLCGSNFFSGKKVKLPYKARHAPADQKASNLHFCSATCQAELEIRLDAYTVGDRVLARDGGKCADCGKECSMRSEWDAAHVLDIV
eukprot:CAMPEP_0181029026 /NCGR_PEP_ID=MMETSP1070-20121207/4978_1 /TAXON_ID=265543 /ORGANISM="Minutocellus polymorphus, Strain NH13" /LENGTH=119 /DNA_ID=CAMNT_0023106307 /DNA_START=86 /DNA_END=441 /DNA_ORIENTATION=-